MYYDCRWRSCTCVCSTYCTALLSTHSPSSRIGNRPYLFYRTRKNKAKMNANPPIKRRPRAYQTKMREEKSTKGKPESIPNKDEGRGISEGQIGGDLSQAKNDCKPPPPSPPSRLLNDPPLPLRDKDNTARVSPIKRRQRDDGRSLRRAGGASGGPCLSRALSVLPQDSGRPSRAAKRERCGEGLSRKGTMVLLGAER